MRDSRVRDSVVRAGRTDWRKETRGEMTVDEREWMFSGREPMRVGLRWVVKDVMFKRMDWAERRSPWRRDVTWSRNRFWALVTSTTVKYRSPKRRGVFEKNTLRT